MSSIRLLSGAEQVAVHLRAEIAGGRWESTIPGIHFLADELGVNHKTVKAALEILERQGLLVGQGPGRRRRIERVHQVPRHDRLRIAILAGDAANKAEDYMLKLHHELVEAGNEAFFVPGSLDELHLNLRRPCKSIQGARASHSALVSTSF